MLTSYTHAVVCTAVPHAPHVRTGGATPFGWMARLALGLVCAVALALALRPAGAEALIQTGELWPNGSIPVCWRQDAYDNTYHAAQAALVQDIVENNWARVADIHFYGWGRCTGTVDDLPDGTIAVHWSEDDGNKPPKADVGYRSDFRTFVRLAPIEKDKKTEAQFTGDVLHEFGHALGFAHEIDHPERNGALSGQCRGTPDTDATVLTPFDALSIMAYTYCTTAPGSLSPLDIVGVQNAYGPKVGGSVVGLNNQCLDIPDEATAVQVNLQVFNCHGGANQVWDSVSDATLRSTFGGIRRCVDVPTNVVASSGTPLQTFSCHGEENQQFTFHKVELRGVGNKCVDVPSATYAPGQYVQLFDCTGGSNQLWTVEAGGGRIKSSASSYCLEVPSGTAASGTLLRLALCNGGAAQRFSFTSYGEIKFGGLCVDSQSGQPTNGARLQLYTCKPNVAGQAGWDKRNQQWHLTGPIRGLGGQCLDIKGGAGVDRAKAQLYPCTGNPNQRWDYYFK